MTVPGMGASILAIYQTLHRKQGKPVKKLGAGSRATFISPYLRRPLRPLDKVLSEREEQPDEGTSGRLPDATVEEPASAVWSLSRKSAAD